MKINIIQCYELHYLIVKNRFGFFQQIKTLYAVLNVNEKSNNKQLKTAYYKMCKKYHPYVNDGKKIKFLKLMNANDNISDSGINDINTAFTKTLNT